MQIKLKARQFGAPKGDGKFLLSAGLLQGIKLRLGLLGWLINNRTSPFGLLQPFCSILS